MHSEYKVEENKNSTRKHKKINNINKEIDKEEPCKIDIKMSEPSKEDKSIKTKGSKGKVISENKDIDKDKNDNS
ncbi:hypothetical protein F8M41_014572 [Gigaspora margarita]|uniref:Uncharacterized protein n=1 Tax=Gigaspora margarita TaxID=4874 RepID=A0A8H4B5Q0_GIGMA|nr:hypothetical protein F8M41_014572 [Gigaspora margarita]